MFSGFIFSKIYFGQFFLAISFSLSGSNHGNLGTIFVSSIFCKLLFLSNQRTIILNPVCTFYRNSKNNLLGPLPRGRPRLKGSNREKGDASHINIPDESRIIIHIWLELKLKFPVYPIKFPFSNFGKEKKLGFPFKKGMNPPLFPFPKLSLIGRR